MRGVAVVLLLSALAAAAPGNAADPVWRIPGVKAEAEAKLALDGDRAALEIVYTGTTAPKTVTVAVSGIFSNAEHLSTPVRILVETVDESGKKCVVNSEAGVKAMKLRASFALVHKISDPTVTVATHPLPASDLAVGRVSMFITHPGSVAQFGPKRMKDIMVVRHPQLDPSNPITATYGFALSVNPQISEKRQKAVHKFIRYLSENPKMWLERVGTVNPHAGILDIPGVRERPYIDVFVNDISSGVPLTQSPKYNEIADAMHRAMERVVLNRADPKKSLDQACKEIDRALARP